MPDVFYRVFKLKMMMTMIKRVLIARVGGGGGGMRGTNQHSLLDGLDAAKSTFCWQILRLTCEFVTVLPKQVDPKLTYTKKPGYHFRKLPKPTHPLT